MKIYNFEMLLGEYSNTLYVPIYSIGAVCLLPAGSDRKGKLKGESVPIAILFFQSCHIPKIVYYGAYVVNIVV